MNRGAGQGDEPGLGLGRGEEMRIPGLTPGVPLNEQAVQQFVGNVKEQFKMFLRS